MVSAKKSDSVNWFSQIMNHIPVQVGNRVSVNVSNFSLNNIIPKASYFIFNTHVDYWDWLGVAFILYGGYLLLRQNS